MSQFDLDEIPHELAPVNARKMEKLEKTMERGFEKGVVEAERSVSASEQANEKALQVADAIVVIRLVLREIHDDVVHESFRQRYRVERVDHHEEHARDRQRGGCSRGKEYRKLGIAYNDKEANVVH